MNLFKILIAAALSLSVMVALPACSTLSAAGDGLTSVKAPAPLAGNIADERAFITLYSAYNTTLDSVKLLIEAGVITPGSETALKIANFIDAATLAINGADDARRAGNAENYIEALGNAENAFRSIESLINGGPG